MVTHYSWRGLFFFEGIVSLALIAIWLPLISDRPEEAKWISKEEKEYLLTTLAAKERAIAVANMKSAGQVKWSYKQLFMDKNIWIMAILYVCYTSGTYGYLIWLPTLLKEPHQDEPDHRRLAQRITAGCRRGRRLLVRRAFRPQRESPHLVRQCLWGFGVAFWVATLFPQTHVAFLLG